MISAPLTQNFSSWQETGGVRGDLVVEKIALTALEQTFHRPAGILDEGLLSYVVEYATPSATIGGGDLSDEWLPTTYSTPTYAASSANPLESIDWGTKLSTTTIDYYFAPSGTYIDGVTDFSRAIGFTKYQKDQIRLALAEFSKVLELEFRETSSQDGAEFRFGAFELDAYDAVAFMVPPGDPYSGFMGFDPDYLGWVDGVTGDPMLTRGGTVYSILLEEIAHGLGLAHMHDEGGSSTIWEGVTAPIGSYGTGSLNQGVYTLMGYNYGWPAGPNGDVYSDGTYLYAQSFGFEATPMALDIAVLQGKYGANLRTGASDSVYELPSSNRLGTSFKTIWDVGGSDTLSYNGSRDATLDLRQATLGSELGGGGYVSHAQNVLGGFTIANGTVIENALGGSGSDKINGNSAANTLDGADGEDTLLGGDGDDLLNGQNGNDTLNGETEDTTFDPVAAQVFRLYQAALDRAPDPLGFDSWTDRLLTNTITLQQAANGFVNSVEFQKTYGNTTNSEFAILLYNNVLDRGPDPTGLAYWTQQLDSGALTRPEVVLRFSESAEFRTNTAADVLSFSRAGIQSDWSDDVFRLYQATLDRNPDPTGFESWTTALTEDREYLSVISGFVNSVEFQNNYGNTTNIEFVTLLYNNVLDRGPDPTGLANWTRQLDGGALTRAEVVSRFAQSIEFRSNSADSLETWMRGQGGDRLNGGSGDNLFFGGIGADRFVFDTSDGGTQTIADMEAWDTVVIENSSYANANALIAALTQIGDDVLLNDSGTIIHFENNTLSIFDADMFGFV